MDDLTDQELHRFLRAYDPMQSVFHEGDPGAAMYVVQEGEVEIQKTTGGEVISLTRIGKGEFFGEMALVESSPRSASAVAGPQGAKLLAIDRSHFVYLVGQQPAFALVVLEVMASRLRAANAKLEAAR